MRFKRKRAKIRILKDADVFLGEKSDPLISCCFLRIKLNFTLNSEEEVKKLIAFLFSLGLRNFSIFSDSILVALSPGQEKELVIEKLTNFLKASFSPIKVERA